MASSLTTTAVRTFLISSPSAGSNRIRHTSPRRGTGLVVIQFLLAKRLKAGQVLVGAVILFGQLRRRSQNGLSLLTRHPAQLGGRQPSRGGWFPVHNGGGSKGHEPFTEAHHCPRRCDRQYPLTRG